MPEAARLHDLRAAIGKAAALSGRKAEDVTLVAVSKGRTADEIEPLLAAGQRDFGENRVQEAADKWPALRSRYPDVQLHMIGQLQSNKAEQAAHLFDAIHSLDRPSLMTALAKAGWTGPSFVQVNIGEEEQKGGVTLDDLPAFLAQVRASPLELAGLMAIPPAGLEASPFFALLAKLARRHDAKGLSMGMSNDFASAVMLGATHVRIGSALFD